MRVRLSSSTLRSFPFLLVALSSCSVLYDLSPDQCESRSDCAKFGSNYSCEAGLCKAPPNSQGGTTSTGGMSSESGGTGEGGSERGGRGGAGGIPSKGGDGGGGDIGNAGAGNDTGSGGSIVDPTGGAGGTGEPPPECVTHADCLAEHDDLTDPYACVQNSCVPLTSDDCPLVLPIEKEPLDSLYSSDALIIGAYAFMPPASTVGIMSSNYDLVLNLFHNETGIKPLSGAQRRKIVTVVCKNSSGSADPAEIRAYLEGTADHLIDGLKVPAIVAPLSARDVQYIFDYKAHANNVFIMAPNYADETLINYDDDALIWHMLSGANYVGVAYKPLLDMTLTHLRNLPTPALGQDEDAKVQLVTVGTNDERFLEDLGTTIRDTIEFNGMSAFDNGNATPPTFDTVVTTSYYADPMASQTDVINSVLEFGPHVVISSNTHEIYTAIPEIERQWAAAWPGKARPFYLLSPFVYNQLVFLGTALDTYAAQGLRERMLGVNWPAAADPRLYNAYQAAFNLAYKDRAGSSAGYENFYDAMYYLVYGMAAAWRTIDVDRGAAIVDGMRRTSNISSLNEFNVGENVQAALNILERTNNNAIRLIGAMGPPNWDTAGARQDAGSVWCIKPDKTEQADVLRYTLTGTLEGDVSPCFTFPAQP